MNSEFIKKICKYILTSLGTVYRSDDIENYNTPVTMESVYEGFGLEIIADDLPGKSNAMDYINEIRIFYREHLVFDSKNNRHVFGIWEDILKELYEKTPILVEERNEYLKRLDRCTQIIKTMVEPLMSKGVKKINDSISLHSYHKQSDYKVNNCGSYELEHHYAIYKDGNCVLHMIGETYSGLSLEYYIPGDWELEIFDYYKNFDDEQAKKDVEIGQEFLREIRSLK